MGGRRRCACCWRRGTDPDAADPGAAVDGAGNTALHYAAQDGHEEAVGALAEGGADLDKARSGTTPLMMAAQFGYSGVVRRLLELGADHTAVDNEGKTALEAAEAAAGKEEIAAVLKAWAAGTRDTAELDRLAAEAPTGEEDDY